MVDVVSDDADFGGRPSRDNRNDAHRSDGEAEDFTVPPPGCSTPTVTQRGVFSNRTAPADNRGNIFDSSTFWEDAAVHPEIFVNHANPKLPRFVFKTVTHRSFPREALPRIDNESTI